MKTPIQCLSEAKAPLNGIVLESLMDAAFFRRNILSILHRNQVKFTVSVPFERLSQLKETVETWKRWD